MEYSSLPILFVDKDGVLLGVACPPLSDPDLNEELIKEINKLADFGLRNSKNNRRGPFEIIQYGLQMGAGSSVSFHYIRIYMVCCNTHVVSRSSICFS
jgi:hypothetical protein